MCMLFRDIQDKQDNTPKNKNIGSIVEYLNSYSLKILRDNTPL